MNKLIKLIKVLLKNSGQIQVSKSKLLNNLFIGFILLCLLPFGYSLNQMTIYLYEVLEPLDQQGVLVAYALVAVGMMIFFFGIFYVLGTFYYAKDIEMLLHMPFSPYQIIGAKLVTVIIYEYIVTAFVFIPVVLTYGVMSHAGIIFYLYSVIIFVLIPVIPLVIGGIFVMIIMAFTSFGKRKEFMTFAGTMLVLTVALGFNVIIQTFAYSNPSEDDMIMIVLQGENTLANVIAQLFPGMEFASNTLIRWNELGGFLNLLIFIVITVIAVGVFLFVGEKLYFKGVIGITESGSKREAISDDDWNKNKANKNVLISYVIREFKVLLRSPIFFMNNLLISVLIPVIFIGMFIFVPEGDKDVEALMNLIMSSDLLAQKIAVFFGLGVMFGSMNGITATGISREGSGAYIMKYLPTPILTQVGAKIVLCILVGVFGMVVFAGGTIYLGLGVAEVLFGLLISVNGIILTALTGMIVDLMRPKLVWDNEQQAVKQNLNTMINLVIGGGLGFGLGFVVFKFSLSTMVTLIIYGLIIGVVNVILYRVMVDKSIPRFMSNDL